MHLYNIKKKKRGGGELLASIQVADVNAVHIQNDRVYYLLVSFEFLKFTVLLSIHALH